MIDAGLAAVYAQLPADLLGTFEQLRDRLSTQDLLQWLSVRGIEIEGPAVPRSSGTPVLITDLPPLEPPDHPLVSIITPTINRPELARCIASVEEQTYLQLEHIVVGDGVEPEISNGRAVLRRTFALGRNWTTARTGPGCYATNAGLLLAQGEYLYMLPDDDWIEPDCIATLVEGIEDRDMCSAQGLMLRDGQEPYVEGDGPFYAPCCLFHHRLLEFAMYQPSNLWAADHPGHDGDLMGRWMVCQAAGNFIPRVLHHHRIDH